MKPCAGTTRCSECFFGHSCFYRLQAYRACGGWILRWYLWLILLWSMCLTIGTVKTKHEMSNDLLLLYKDCLTWGRPGMVVQYQKINFHWFVE